MDRGAWQATVNGVAKESDETERLSRKQTRNPRAHVPFSQDSPLLSSDYVPRACGWYWFELGSAWTRATG